MHEIKNIDPSGLNNFLEDERMNCYWFWFKGKITRRMDSLTEEIYEQDLSGSLEWNGIRFRNGFYTVFDIFLLRYTMSGKWNGQTKAEFDKNFKRVADIVAKADGDNEKAIKLAKQQTAKICDEWKAINRAMAAKQAGHEHIFEVFFQRAYELGSVSKQEYREYKLEKLGI
jgi:hypothetical protein